MIKKKLNKIRRGIDCIDSSIVKLLNRRGRLSSEIGVIKKIRNYPVYSPDRESVIYNSVASKGKGPLSTDSLKAIYREIMSACLSLEQPIVVAYFGPELTYTHQASMRKFGSSVTYLPCDNIPEVFREVEKGNADYGVVPVENSIEGAVNHTADMFVDSPLLICSEAYLRVRHSLLSKAQDIKSVKRIYSHPQVFGQCRMWIEKNAPWAKLVETSSTSRAAEIVSKMRDSACIASSLAAERYQLQVLKRSIEDSANNVTRFLIIGKQMAGVTGHDKTSILFSVKDKPGVLHDTLAAFKAAHINMSKIESRPSRVQAWKYYFFVDIEGHCEDKKVKRALEQLADKCNFVKVLGSYPKV
ncbi:MAG TPA: prephenate dehydratase [Candidatus Omnitrophota bacterium]|mgnify:CR=1 FL=1|nr:prephenate dehydratase [Candidatus Omnitrophota bacterium]HPS19875.1 prephenate dehydratase [Candidatus Omnitrophota bacterium]